MHRWRAALATVSSAVVIAAVLPAVPAAAATPTVTGAGTFAYTEQEGPIAIGTGITITNGSFYDGEYIDFVPGDASGAEQLSLTTDDSASTTAGVVSVVGTSVYLGNGTTADIIGSVDAILDGQDGRALRINFTSNFVNPGFETGDITGWTALDQRIDVGTTSIAGCPTVDTSSYAGDTTNQDNNVPINPGAYSSDVVTTGDPNGLYTLQLESGGIITLAGFDVVHGPAVYSSEFEVAANDSIFFDWRAFAGDDAFHVFGYIIDESCNQLEVLDAVGVDATGSTDWATTETVIPQSGTYRFVFVSGTYDFTGGQVAGARLLIDNVRVFGTEKASDDAVQQIARRLRYANDADDPPASQTITVTAVNSDAESGSDQITVNIAGVDDPPTLAVIAPSTLSNSDDGAQTFANQTGTLDATDPDHDPISYDIVGGDTVTEDIGGTTYTRARVGTYGVLYLNVTTGAYVYVPDDNAINAHSSGDDSDEFMLTATAADVTVERTYTVAIDVEESEPGAATDLTANPGFRRVDLTWSEPSWLGGSPVTGYRVESSVDGGAWTEVIADTGSASTSYAVTGLDIGVEVRFRVSAINTTGTGSPSGVASATPRGSSPDPAPTPTPPPPGEPEGEDPAERVSDDVPDGGTVTTDPGGTGPTQGQPVTGAVRTPVAGTVTIVVNDPRSDDDIDGLGAFARAVDIDAPDTSPGDPLQVTLRVDASQLPGTDEGRVVLLKDGVPVTASCLGASADPDPCIASRTVTADGDLLIEVLSSSGGRFAFTEPTHACPTSLAVSGRFAEVTGVHAGAVDCITWWRPSTGFTDDTYRDQVAMTRGQLASILASSLDAGGVRLPDAPGMPFDDLKGSVHAEAVAQLAALGLLNGVDRDTFAPNRRLTRAQTAAILVRIAEHLEGSPLPAGERDRFSDIGGNVHREVILVAAAAGFTQGYGDGRFRPAARVTRGQGATFVVRMLDRMVNLRHVDLPL